MRCGTSRGDFRASRAWAGRPDQAGHAVQAGLAAIPSVSAASVPKAAPNTVSGADRPGPGPEHPASGLGVAEHGQAAGRDVLFAGARGARPDRWSRPSPRRSRARAAAAARSQAPGPGWTPRPRPAGGHLAAVRVLSRARHREHRDARARQSARRQSAGRPDLRAGWPDRTRSWRRRTAPERVRAGRSGTQIRLSPSPARRPAGKRRATAPGRNVTENVSIVTS